MNEDQGVTLACLQVGNLMPINILEKGSGAMNGFKQRRVNFRGGLTRDQAE